MRAILFLLVLSFNLSAEIGWKGNVFTVGSVVQNGTRQVVVTSDDQPIDVSGMAIINLDSDSASATSRSVIPLQGSSVGQRVRFTCRPANGNSQIADNAAIPGGGNVRLVNNWVCNQDGSSLTLFWNGTDWEEDSRVNL